MISGQPGLRLPGFDPHPSEVKTISLIERIDVAHQLPCYALLTEFEKQGRGSTCSPYILGVLLVFFVCWQSSSGAKRCKESVPQTLQFFGLTTQPHGRPMASARCSRYAAECENVGRSEVFDVFELCRLLLALYSLLLTTCFFATVLALFFMQGRSTLDRWESHVALRGGPKGVPPVPPPRN